MKRDSKHYRLEAVLIASLCLSSTSETCYGFYTRARVDGFLPTSSGRILVTRTYEFARSSSIYEQLALQYTRGSGNLMIREWVWGLGTTSNQRIRVQAITNDFLVQIPDGSLGGLNAGLAGHEAICHPLPACRQGPSRLLVNPQGKLADGTTVALSPGHVFLANRLISINADREPVPDFDRYPYPDYQVDLGMIQRKNLIVVDVQP